jgi:hypothetical protein
VIRIMVDVGGKRLEKRWDGERALTAGRLDTCSLTVPHSDVSRRHFRIVPTDAGFTLEDLGSLNGVELNGVLIEEPVPLFPGDELRIGEHVRILFGDGPEAGGVAPPSAAEIEVPEIPSLPEVAPSAPSVQAPEAGQVPSPRDTAAPLREPTAASAARAPGSQQPTATERRRRAGRSRRRQHPAVTWSIWIATAIGLAIFARIAHRMITDPIAPAPAVAGGDTTPSASAVVSRPAAPSFGTPGTSAPDASAVAWERLDAADLDPDLLVAALDDFAVRYASSPYAERARRRAELLRRMRREAAGGDGGAAAVSTLAREIERLLGEGLYGEAWYLAQNGPRLGIGDEDTARRHRQRIQDGAYEVFGRAREIGRGLLRAGRPLAAYEAVARTGLRMQALPFYDEVSAELDGLRRSLERALEVIAADAATGGAEERGELDILKPQAKRAVLACDFPTAIEAYRRMLALPLTAAERLEAQWALYDARRMQDLFRWLLAEVAAQDPGRTPIRVRLTDGIVAEVTAADVEGVRFEAMLEGESSRPVVEKRWRELAPATIAEVFSGLPLDADGALASAAYAFHAGLEDDAHTALLTLWERFPAYRAEAAALLGRRTGTDARAEQLSAFEGRLVSAAERGGILARRDEARRKAQRLREELATAKAEAKAATYLAKAVEMLDAGNYLEGHAVLTEIVKRLPDTETAARAKTRLDDPFLRRRPIEVTGEDEHRISIVFLAEGYQLDADQQRRFDRAADRAWAILKKEEPWAEYGGWVNVYAMNLWAVDEGVDREPGNVQKDTPLGGQVRDGTFTVDMALARSFVERFPGPSIAVCIGNDSASVATGGGGVCAVAKGMLGVTGHEIGHAFAALGDEYDSDPGGGGGGGGGGRAQGDLPSTVLAPNLIEGNKKSDMRAKAPWAHWVELGPDNWTGQPVDLYEGGNRTPFDVWRPQADCNMRTTGSRFCAPCMEQMVLGIYGATRPIDAVHPEEDVVSAGKADRPLFRVVALKPQTRPLEAEYVVEEVLDGSAVTGRREPMAPLKLKGEGAELPDGRFVYGARARGLEPGRYTVTATLKDPTAWVAQPDRSRLEQSHTWQLVVE